MSTNRTSNDYPNKRVQMMSSTSSDSNNLHEENDGSSGKTDAVATQLFTSSNPPLMTHHHLLTPPTQGYLPIPVQTTTTTAITHSPAIYQENSSEYDQSIAHKTDAVATHLFTSLNSPLMTHHHLLTPPTQGYLPNPVQTTTTTTTAITHSPVIYQENSSEYDESIAQSPPIQRVQQESSSEYDQSIAQSPPIQRVQQESSSEYDQSIAQSPPIKRVQQESSSEYDESIAQSPPIQRVQQESSSEYDESILQSPIPHQENQDHALTVSSQKSLAQHESHLENFLGTPDRSPISLSYIPPNVVNQTSQHSSLHQFQRLSVDLEQLPHLPQGTPLTSLKREIDTLFQRPLYRAKFLEASTEQQLIQAILNEFISLKNSLVCIPLNWITVSYNVLFETLADTLHRLLTQEVLDRKSLSTLASLYQSLQIFDPDSTLQTLYDLSAAHRQDYPHLYQKSISEQFNSPNMFPSTLSQLRKNPLYTIQEWSKAPWQTSQSATKKTLFVLRNAQDAPVWTLHPLTEFVGEESLIKGCYASMLNFHQEFPLPETFLIQIKETLCVIQSFIPQATSLLQLENLMYPAPTLVELQKILIFDLLFSNQNRIKDNIVIQFQANPWQLVMQPYGISNQSCFYRDNGMKIEYLDMFSADIFFDPRTHHLFSQQNCERYKAIMTTYDMPSDAIQFMLQAGHFLRARVNTTSLLSLACELRDRNT